VRLSADIFLHKGRYRRDTPGPNYGIEILDLRGGALLGQLVADATQHREILLTPSLVVPDVFCAELFLEVGTLVVDGGTALVDLPGERRARPAADAMGLYWVGHDGLLWVTIWRYIGTA
jgi:hypothetical protein